MLKLVITSIFLFVLAKAFAQDVKVNDHNNIVWLQTHNTIAIKNKWSAQVEYQWRRTNGVKDWQQSLLRIGANYKANEQVTFHLGYGWIETFAYGDFPIANAGIFPEHRIYEQVVIKQQLQKLLLSHRFRIEQRWLGRVMPNTDRTIEKWIYLNRFRYQVKAQYPIHKKFYVAGVDEIFIGAGKNLGINFFDQNRIYVLLGHKINKNISIELGYLNQILQQGRRVSNNIILQKNNGFSVATTVQL